MIKSFALLLILYIFPIIVSGQTNDPVYSPSNAINAIYPGGQEALARYLSRCLKDVRNQPVAKNLNGKVYVSFVVEKDGSIETANVLKGIDSVVDLEIIHCFTSMPRWIPGTIDEQPVRIRYLIPIAFGPEDGQKSNAPSFVGGARALDRYLSKKLNKTCSWARKNGIHGNVLVRFVVDRSGAIADVQIANGIHPEIDKAVKEVFENMPKWEPGRANNGDATTEPQSLPIYFQ